jgi:hypothetical protein
VPHSAQNFAAWVSGALQLVQCFCIAVPHSLQNLAPTGTAALQLPHVSVGAAGAGAGGAAAG